MGLSKQSTTSAALAVAASAAFMFGLSHAQAADNFAMVQAVVNPYYSTWPQAAKDASADFGINVEIASPQDFDQVQQDAVVNSLIAKGMKGIGIQPVDAVAGAETVKRVIAAGVPVVGVAACAELEGTGAAMCINNALGDSAYEATKLVCQTIGGKGNIVHLDGQLADKNTAARVAGVDKALAEMPGCKLLQRITDIDSAEASRNAVSSLLASKGDQVNGIVSGAYNPSVAVAKEFTQRKEAKIKAVLVDDDKVVMDAVKGGFVLASRVSNPYMLAYVGSAALKKIADGCKWTGDFILPNNYATITADKVDTLAQDNVAAAKAIVKGWDAKWSCTK
ncbi:MAG TPA: substrate-binding domain-containing protein [Bauldia sp.]|nr:substrate-binding domain-containing protein [Bauldia sp.]